MYEKNPIGVIAFVNFGHSNLQVSIVKFTNYKMEVLVTTSEKNLGGRDFDKLIYDLALKKLSAQDRKRVIFILNITFVF